MIFAKVAIGTTIIFCAVVGLMWIFLKVLE